MSKRVECPKKTGQCLFYRVPNSKPALRGPRYLGTVGNQGEKNGCVGRVGARHGTLKREISLEKQPLPMPTHKKGMLALADAVHRSRFA